MTTPSTAEPTPLRLDGHVHVVGDGSSGNGCWMRTRGWLRQLSARGMAFMGGLPQRALREGLDEAYRLHLTQLLETSTLDGAVLLAMDLVHDAEGRAQVDRSPYYVPNQVVLDWAREDPKVYAGVSIHPARPDALEELDRCVAEGAALVKFLPNVHQIDPSRPAYDPFWERMAELGIPLLAHTGGEYALPDYRPEWANPLCLERPAEIGVKVIAAHCGGRGAPWDPDYFPRFCRMAQRYPNYYGDISALNLPLRMRLIPRLRQPELARKLIHGSDFPVPVMGQLLPWLGYLSRADYRRCRRERNPLERDYQFKKACRFPDEVFTRLARLLPPGAVKAR